MLIFRELSEIKFDKLYYMFKILFFQSVYILPVFFMINILCDIFIIVCSI